MTFKAFLFLCTRNIFKLFNSANFEISLIESFVKYSIHFFKLAPQLSLTRMKIFF